MIYAKVRQLPSRVTQGALEVELRVRGFDEVLRKYMRAYRETTRFVREFERVFTPLIEKKEARDGGSR